MSSPALLFEILEQAQATDLSCVRVLSVPEGHVYVRHLSHPDGNDGVVRLPDPCLLYTSDAADE